MIQLFNYNGNNVSFRKENNNVFVNATEMAKPYNKRPNDYFNLIATKELIKAITIKNGIANSQLVITERGGLNPGTWLNEDLAIDFAQWLSVDFRLWVSDRIKELMKYGFTATSQTLESLANNPDLLIELATALKTERAEKEALNIVNGKLNAKSQFVDTVFNTDALLSFEQAAKVLGLPYGRNTLVKKLKELGILFKNKTSPKQNYVDKGFFRVKEDFKPEINRVFAQTFITQKGLAFIAGKLNVITPSVDQVKSIA
ncbi:hypothetical protein CMT54_18210 [Elizabethkingia anophelis]|nr:hypothetical protein [Elizabethkingia anophelis]